MTSRMRLCGVLLAASLLGTQPVSAQTLVRSWFGGQTADVGKAGLSLGDVDGDGYSDIFLVPWQTTGTSYFGRAYSGRTGAVLWSRDITTFGITTGASTGVETDSRGDINDDGVADPLLLGLGAAMPLTGENIILDGKTGNELRRMYGAVAYRAYTVRYCGDIDADGADDLVNANQAPNQVLILSGRTGAVIRVHAFVRPSPEYLLDAHGCGDVDGDGYDDFAVRYGLTPMNLRATAMDVISGQSGHVLQTFTSPANASSGWGTTIPVGDVDGDLADDFVIPDPGWVPTGSPPTDVRGGISVYSLANTQPLVTATGAIPWAYFGSSVSAAGDVDGDGRADVLVGAHSDGWGYPLFISVGSLTVVYGGGQPPLRLLGTAYQQRFGFFVAKVEDLSGDGMPDALVGAVGDDTAGPDFGAAYAYSLPQLANPSQFTAVGHACLGSTLAAPRIRGYGHPRSGAPMRIGMRGAPPGAASVLIMGGDQALGLDALGATGCVLYSTIDWTGFFFADGSGRAFHPVIVPTAPALIGVQQTLSWLVFDAPANALGVTTSNGLRLRIGG